MRICKVWDSDYPWDVRASKIAGTLTAAGHDVHLVARNRLRRPTLERLPEATVHRMRPWPGAALNAASGFPAFFNPRWLSAIHSACVHARAELILVRDLPLAPAAIAVGRRLDLPVVLDMAENYPAMMQSLWDNGVQGRWDFVVRNPRVVSAIERWVLRHIDHVLVVVEESRGRLVSLGLPADRITLVGNTPPLARLDQTEPRTHQDTALHLNYLGLVEAPRGLGIAIEALARCASSGIPARLSVIGDGRERRRFETQARDRGLDDSTIRFYGRLPHDEALRLLPAADIGLIPHQASEEWNTTVPNKLFDYMVAGLAIITSDARPAARIVTETHTGTVFRYDDVDSLVAAIRALQGPARRSEFGRHGRAAIRDTYHWEADAARLEIALTTAARARARAG